MEFTHLHVHTDASLRDGLGSVPRLIGQAKALGFGQIAMTDHGTLANAISFTTECQYNGIKPIMGLEGYIHYDDQVGHITLLADGNEGWQSLIRLNNLAHENSRFRSPAFSIDQLMENQSGLVCLTGCIASPFHQYSNSDAMRLGVKLKSVFGSRLFAEVMFVADLDTWSRPFMLADKLGLKLVLTNDVHFPMKTDAEIHAILTKMKAGFAYNSGELWLKTPEELIERAKAHDVDELLAVSMMRRAFNIGSKIQPVNLQREPVLPFIGDSNEKLRKRVFAVAKTLPADYQFRAEYELSVIEKMDYSTYFLILDDIIHHARENGVRVGPGRGSGAGSLILNILGITQVDPIKYGLQFERFLNPERRGMPDVDVDFDSERRDIVLEYAKEFYNAHQISTYARYSHKTLVHDLSKMFSVPRDLEKQAAEEGETSDALRKIFEDFPKFQQCYEAFMGAIRHKGKHAGGVIITDVSVPLERMGDTVAASWTEGSHNELSYAGIVKFDLLGLSALSVLRRLETNNGFSAPPPEDGSPVFSLFVTGELSGIFQFAGSEGIRKLTMELAPTKFEDLIAINALYRPGALDAGAVEKYPSWKISPRKMPAYIADVLDPTYGAIVYQEQVMEIFRRTIGGSLGEADLARRIIVKSKPEDKVWVEKFEKIKADFIAGAIRQGLSEKGAAKLWGELATHSRYSFNKSHSTAYAMIAWELAWWKFYHPAEFYTEMLNVDGANAQTYIFDAVKQGIKVSVPSAIYSGDEYVSEDGTIYLPLSVIKFMGKNGALEIIRAREEKEFTSLHDFMARVAKKLCRARGREGLLALNSFYGLPVEDGGEPIGAIEEEPIASTIKISKKLGLKGFAPSGNWAQDQLQYLGFIIPDSTLLKIFEDYEKFDMTCGIITGKKMKESRYGAYAVYTMSPGGVFWSRDKKDLPTGTIVAVNISEKNGKGQEIQIIMRGKAR